MQGPQPSRPGGPASTDELEKIAGAHTSDDAFVVLRARGATAVGDYARAESLLQPLAAKTPGGDAAVELGVLQTYQGKRAEARKTLQYVLLAAQNADTARDFLRAGRAARALGRFEDANAFFREAVALAPDDVEINTAWGELFLEKYNHADAVRSFEPALKADADYAPALLGMARALADDNPPQAMAFAQRALKANPRNVAAMLVMAEGAIGNDRKPEAHDWLAKAKAVNPKSLETLSLEGALAYVQGDTATFQARGAEVLKIHPALRRVLPGGRLRHRRLLPVRRGGRARAARDSTGSRELARLCGSGRAPDADGRRARRPTGARDRIPRRIPTTPSPTTCSNCWTTSTSSAPSSRAS